MNAQNVSYTADGNCAVFAYPFPVFEPLDIEVVIDGIVQTAGFTLLGDGANSGGAVRFDTAPASGKAVMLRRAGKVQVSATDAPGFLEAKLVAGANVTVTPTSDSAGEHLVIAGASVASCLAVGNPGVTLGAVGVQFPESGKALIHTRGRRRADRVFFCLCLCLCLW